MEYNYNVKRTNRKSISVSVSNNNEITVRCPKRFSDSAIKQFILSKSEWIARVINQNNIKNSLNRDIIDYKKVYVNGIMLPLIILDKNEITDNAVFVKGLRYIKNTYILHFSQEFTEWVKSLALEYNFKYSSVSFKKYKRRWGCCDINGNITFNYLLFMLPKSIQRYVILHELCHTVYFNHSSAFWRLLSSIEHDYKSMRAQLKCFDFITNLY